MVLTRMHTNATKQSCSQKPASQNEANSCFSDAHLTQDFEAMAGLQNSYQSQFQEYVKQSVGDIDRDLLTNNAFETIDSNCSQATGPCMNTISNDSGVATSETQNEIPALKVKKYNKKQKVGTLTNTKCNGASTSFNSVICQVCMECNSCSCLTPTVNSNNFQCPNKKKRSQKKKITNIDLQLNCSTDSQINCTTDSQLNYSTESALGKQYCNPNFETSCTILEKLNETVSPEANEIICTSAEVQKVDKVSIFDVICQMKEFDKIVDDFRANVTSELEVKMDRLNMVHDEKLAADVLEHDGDEDVCIFCLNNEYKQLLNDENESAASVATTPLQLSMWKNYLDKYENINFLT